MDAALSAEKAVRVVVSPGGAICGHKVVASNRGVRVVRPDTFATGDSLLVESDGLGQTAHLKVHACEVVAGGQGVGVVGSEDSFAVGEVSWCRVMASGETPRRPIGLSEVVAGSQSVRVVGSEDSFAVGSMSSYRVMASARCPTAR